MKMDAFTPRSSMKRWLVPAALLATFSAGAWYWLSSGIESTDDAQIEAHVVPVAAKLAGYVAGVSVDDNQPVKAGDTLLALRTKDFQIHLDNAKAALAEA